MKLRQCLVALLLGLGTIQPGLQAADPASQDPGLGAADPCAPATLERASRHVRGLMQAGRVGLAKALLLEMRACDPRSHDARFLLGQIALAGGDHDRAIQLYREMLVEDPDLPRVRLELGRAFFLKRDDGNAERQFRLALAGDLPPGVVANVEGLLEAIRRRKGWSVDLSLGLAPDTNVNAAPTVRTVTLFGQPFTLSEDARKQSGVGLSVSAGGQIHQPLTPSTQLRLGAQSWTRKYRNDEFDDQTVSAFAGPRFLFGQTDVSLLGRATRRWYGGKGYSRGLGGRIEVNHRPTSRLLVGGAVERLEMRYEEATRANGPLTSAHAVTAYSPSPSSAVHLLAGVTRERTEAEPLRNTSLRVAVGYQKDLPFGISTYLQPELMTTRYDAAQVGFNTTRKDRLLQLRASVLNRRWHLFDFSPVLSYVYSMRRSNIDFYDYERHRLEIGVTRQF